MVRANGQRDGVGKTRQLSGAFEHTGAILDPTRVSPYRPAAVAYAAINEAGHTTAPDRMHRTISRNELSPETGGGPRCAQSASTSRTVTRGCQPASRVLRSAPALAGDCRGRPCGKPLRASQKAGPRSTGTRGRLREPLRCRGEPIQRTRERRVRRYRGDSEKACNLGGVHTRQLPGGIRTR